MRPPVTSRGELEAVAFALFRDRGYDNTSIDDIAAAAGIGRRTMYRYFPAKTDLVWGDFDAELSRLRAWFACCDPAADPVAAIRAAVVDFNRYPAEAEARHRQRMTLILGTPSLLANSTLRFVAWRGLVSAFVAERCGVPVDGQLARTIGHAALGVALAAYELWLEDRAAVLTDLLDGGFASLATGFLDSARVGAQ